MLTAGSIKRIQPDDNEDCAVARMTVPKTANRAGAKAPAAAFDAESIRVLLCDGDGTLFPSEPTYIASAEVLNAFLAEQGVSARYAADELRRSYAGLSFRSVLTQLCAEHQVTPDPAVIEPWVSRAGREVAAHVRTALSPDPDLLGALDVLGQRFSLGLVTSGGAEWAEACLEATGLAACFPPAARFSGEDSLPAPKGKPDPAVYELARAEAKVLPDEGLAVEDSVPGVLAAVAAGLGVVGNLQYVPLDERPARADALLEAGAAAVVSSWEHLLVELLG